MRRSVKAIAITCILAIGQSLSRWHDSYSGFCMEHGKSLLYVKQKAQVDDIHKADSSDGG
ncbi:MAG: hypothetical protein WC756_19200 [Taibaiella sp.]